MHKLKSKRCQFLIPQKPVQPQPCQPYHCHRPWSCKKTQVCFCRDAQQINPHLQVPQALQTSHELSTNTSLIQQLGHVHTHFMGLWTTHTKTKVRAKLLGWQLLQISQNLWGRLQKKLEKPTKQIFARRQTGQLTSANFNFVQLKFVRNLIVRSSSDSHKVHK